MIPTRSLPQTNDSPTWCRCGVHRATVGKPLCPVCLDSEARKAQR